MFLEEIRLLNFKNYKNSQTRFDEHVNCILGGNGTGKTNLLDAIYYLSLGKSAFNAQDSQNMKHDESFFTVQGKFSHESENSSVQCSLIKGEKKILKQNKKPYSKLKDHIGKYPVVLISPYDKELINEGNEIRRRFFNNLLSQTNKDYLNDLIDYNRLVAQRNSLIRSTTPNAPDPVLLSSYDEPICKIAESIHKKRTKCLRQFTPLFKKHYSELSDQREEVEISYESDLEDPEFPIRFQQHLHKDMIMQRTVLGVHRDRFHFLIDGYPAKKFGSQGQQKSFVIGLKLTQFDQIRDLKGFKPILLLDDIFDKLDDLRIHKLMEMVSGDFFGQLFVTDARPERTLSIFKNIDVPHKIFYIKKGKIEEV